jgi:hypothetical protein
MASSRSRISAVFDGAILLQAGSYKHPSLCKVFRIPQLHLPTPSQVLQPSAADKSLAVPVNLDQQIAAVLANLIHDATYIQIVIIAWFLPRIGKSSCKAAGARQPFCFPLIFIRR